MGRERVAWQDPKFTIIDGGTESLEEELIRKPDNVLEFKQRTVKELSEIKPKEGLLGILIVDLKSKVFSVFKK